MTSAPLIVHDFHEQLGVFLAALARLVARLRGAGPLWGAGLAIVGVVLLVAADRLRRPVAVVAGAAVGALSVAATRAISPGSLTWVGWPWVVAGAAGAASAVGPGAFPALSGALLGALLGLHAPVAGRPALGAAVAAAVGAALLAVGGRSVAAVLASVAGGALLGVGIVTLSGGRELAAEVAARPLVLLGFAVVTGIAGAAFQLSGERARSRAPEAPRLPRE